MRQAILYVSQQVADELWRTVPQNLERYLTGSFEDLAIDTSWRMRLSTTYNPEPLSRLDPTEGPETEVSNSLLVWKAFSDLTPALAREDRMWIRFSHVECMEFARKRWLKDATTTDEQALIKSIRKHYFAGTRNGCRDDHAVSRLWWNAKLASIADSIDVEGALRALLQRADTRLNLVERPWLFSRPILAAQIVDFLRSEKWVQEHATHFRELMKAMNLLGNGVAFEVFSEEETRGFLGKAAMFAKSENIEASKRTSKSTPEGIPETS